MAAKKNDPKAAPGSAAQVAPDLICGAAVAVVDALDRIATISSPMMGAVISAGAYPDWYAATDQLTGAVSTALGVMSVRLSTGQSIPKLLETCEQRGEEVHGHVLGLGAIIASELEEARGAAESESEFAKMASALLSRLAKPQPLRELLNALRRGLQAEADPTTEKAEAVTLEGLLAKASTLRDQHKKQKATATVQEIRQLYDDLDALPGHFTTAKPLVPSWVVIGRLSSPNLDGEAGAIEAVEAWCRDQMSRQHFLDRTLKDALTSYVGQLNGKVDDRLVTADEVAGMVHLSRTGLQSYRNAWPNPDEAGAGRRPHKWRLSRLLPILKQQFPKADLNGV